MVRILIFVFCATLTIPTRALAYDQAAIDRLTELMIAGCSLGQHFEIRVRADGSISLLQRGIEGSFEASRTELPSIIRFLEEDVIQREVAADTRECMMRYMDRIFDEVLEGEPEPTIQFTLQPMIENIGRPSGKSGALRRDDRFGFSPPELGDMGGRVESNTEVRAFISFDLAEVPDDARVNVANLYISTGGRSAEINPSYFSRVLIELVDIGGALDGADFARSGTLINEFDYTTSVHEYGPINVTDAINLSRSLGRRIMTLRLRFSVGHDNDNEDDIWALSYSRGETRIEIGAALSG